ncbi:colicin E5-related ribonuclease, partial [Aquitalea sp.]|uniref:colicin E5-related ribonuclease n=1 Tax=Aquitalea sp. TaxID=1872623 RepID=UPI0025853C92
VKQMTTDADGNTNLAANAMAHAALGALLAAAKGQNTTAGAVGGGIAPITADLVMNQLYPGKTVAELSEEQKQTVAALTTLTGTLAGGLTTGNSAGAVTGGQVANNEVLNNTLSPKEINTLGKKLQSQCGTLSGGSKSACENGLITAAVKESNRRNDFSPEYQAAFDATFNKAMADVSTICKANSQCVTEVANSLLMARLSCSTVECANDHAGGAVRNAALRYGSVLDVGKLALGDFGWLVGLKGPSANSMASSVSTVIEPKIAKQMAGRGWTEAEINSTISNPAKTVITKDTRFDPVAGTRLNDPATGYIANDGSYVVRNDRTGQIVQVSDKNDPTWKAPW